MGDKKSLRLPYDAPMSTSWGCANIFVAPFRSEKYTKYRVNDDPCNLRKWCIIDPFEHEMRGNLYWRQGDGEFLFFLG